MNNLKSLRQQVMFMQDHLDAIMLQLKEYCTNPMSLRMQRVDDSNDNRSN